MTVKMQYSQTNYDNNKRPVGVLKVGKVIIGSFIAEKIAKEICYRYNNFKKEIIK